MVKSIKKYWKNWTGMSLALIHAILLAWVIVAKDPLPQPDPLVEPCLPSAFCFDPWEANLAGVSIIAGRSFHFTYENGLFKFLMLIDIPAQIAGALLFIVPIQIFRLSKYAISYLAGLNWLLSGSLQWWLLGTIAEIRLKTKFSKA